MAHQSQNNGGRQTTMRRKRVWLITVVVAVPAVVVWFLWISGFWRDSRGADERLAEIEAARAIPDSENAAIIYNELLRDPNAISLLDYLPESLDRRVFSRTHREPWLSRDLPELAAWAANYRFVIDRLLDASRFEKCRFLITIDAAKIGQMLGRAAPMRRWGYLLSSAANNDIAEGRIDSAMTKWQCLLQMDNHLWQQPVPTDHLTGIDVGESALGSMARFLVRGAPTAIHLQYIEAMPLPTTDDWAKHLKETREIEHLTMRRLTENCGPLDRVRQRLFLWRINYAMYGTLKRPDAAGVAGDLYRGHIATARGIRILVALRRYKNATGRWPASLDEIRASLPAEVLIDPLNGGAFVYQPAPDAFRLYSRGKNNIDENGDWQPEGADDWPIWPPRGRNAEPEQENADGV